jgi:hypothetical protein
VSQSAAVVFEVFVPVIVDHEEVGKVHVFVLPVDVVSVSCEEGGLEIQPTSTIGSENSSAYTKYFIR